MGVFPGKLSLKYKDGGLPHARGGVSCPKKSLQSVCRSSPRPWGCFLLNATTAEIKVVFPTPVGVFPIPESESISRSCLPHARGGVSNMTRITISSAQSSPRPWGCFLGHVIEDLVIKVFPTPVGVFPVLRDIEAEIAGLPHARGGVSVS